MVNLASFKNELLNAQFKCMHYYYALLFQKFVLIVELKETNRFEKMQKIKLL